MDTLRPSTAPTATRARIHRVDDLSYNLERTLANAAAEPTLRAPPWEHQPGVASALFATSTARRTQLIKAQVDALDPHKPIEVVRESDLPNASLRQTMTGGYYLTDDGDTASKTLGKTFASRAGSGPLIPGTVAADTANFGRPSTASSVRKPRTPLDTSRMLSDIPLSRDVLSHPTSSLASAANAAVPARTIRLQMPSKQAQPVRPVTVRPEMHHGRHRNAIAPSHQRFVEALEDDIEGKEIVPTCICVLCTTSQQLM
jgi:hypothetical protein